MGPAERRLQGQRWDRTSRAERLPMLTSGEVPLAQRYAPYETGTTGRVDAAHNSCIEGEMEH